MDNKEIESLSSIDLTKIEDINISLDFCMKSMPCCHSCKIKIEGQWKMVKYVYGTEIYEICKLLNKNLPKHFDYLFNKKVYEKKINEINKNILIK